MVELTPEDIALADAYEAFCNGLDARLVQFDNIDSNWPDDIVEWVKYHGLDYFWFDDFEEEYNSVASAQALVEQLAKGQEVIIYQEIGRNGEIDQEMIWFPDPRLDMAAMFKLAFGGK